MSESWRYTLEYINKRLNSLGKDDLALGVLNNPVLIKRLNCKNPKVRPFPMRLSYSLCGGKNWQSIIPAMACVEMLNIASYVINSIQDEKGGTLSKNEINEYILHGFVLRDLATSFLCDVECSGEVAQKLHLHLSQIVLDCCFGQVLDLKVLNVGELSNSLTLESAKKVYFERTEKISGTFMGHICAMGAILSGVSQESVEHLYSFGLNYGSGIQIVNDLGDFVYSSDSSLDYEKIYKDMYSDIRHGKLTYPVILGLESDLQFREFCRLNLSHIELKEITKRLVACGAVEKVRLASVARYKACRRIVKQFEKCESRDMLSVMSSSLKSNKYFRYFRDFSLSSDAIASREVICSKVFV